MEILLTLPVRSATFLNKNRNKFPDITMAYSDPEGSKVGSGGGTVNVLWRHGNSGSRKIIIHGDGQSRRLPAYSVTGKSLMPFPVFKWGRGQRINQTLVDIQLPFLEKLMTNAPPGINTLVASGDALLWADQVQGTIPLADIICVGVWSQPEVASKHGVFICPRTDTTRLTGMLQKPSAETLQTLTRDNVYLLDSGIWLLSDRATQLLFDLCGWDGNSQKFVNGVPGFYDLYSDFGKRCSVNNLDYEALTVRIFPVDQAGFYHFGSNEDLLRSTGAIHNLEKDQRKIWHKKVKSGQEIFVQNSRTNVNFNQDNHSIWVENSCIPSGWSLHHHHIITGIPENEWNIELPAGICLDMIPVGAGDWCLRLYGFHDPFRGNAHSSATVWCGGSLSNWFSRRGFTRQETDEVLGRNEIFECKLFPVVGEAQLNQGFIQWLLNPLFEEPKNQQDVYREFYLRSRRLAGNEIINLGDISRLMNQREFFLQKSLMALAANHRQSIFYQLDLEHLAGEFIRLGQPLPPELTENEDVMSGIHDRMFRAVYLRKTLDRSLSTMADEMEKQAFSLLRNGMLENLTTDKPDPVGNLHHDQILWGRSPLRLDLAGGWTDTPPYCILFGGRVVNMAVELNGQPPIQVFIRPSDDPVIVIHSIDLGVSEVIRDFKDLSGLGMVGSAFSIPRAALMLAGFHPDYSRVKYPSLREQLIRFGGGFDITQMVAVPKGSGLGTSSILAATILGVLSEFCTLGWDKHETAYRTLLLEQMLTTGGGWQDQLGGIFSGVKLLESEPGLLQKPTIRWAPDHLLTQPEYRDLIMLYYTGITRVAKHILTDIVRGMFLNSSGHLGILAEMKSHAIHTYEAVQHHHWKDLTAAIRHSWELNQTLDPGTNPEQISSIISKIDPYMDSCKLLGAGGGGYLMIFAKDIQAVHRIKTILNSQPPNPGARFVDWKLSQDGFTLTKS